MSSNKPRIVKYIGNKMIMKSIFLPRKNKSTNQNLKLLILDLDETLIHSAYQNNNDHSFCINVSILYSIYLYYINLVRNRWKE